MRPWRQWFTRKDSSPKYEIVLPAVPFEVSFYPNDDRPADVGGGGTLALHLWGDFKVPCIGAEDQGSPGWDYHGRGMFDVGVKMPDGRPVMFEVTCMMNPDGTVNEEAFRPVSAPKLRSHLEVDDLRDRFLLRGFDKSAFVIEQLLERGWELTPECAHIYNSHWRWWYGSTRRRCNKMRSRS